ncbi:MAG: bifunctional proline dehydrogenase/L-glutamate gamma-semialdehyde dehydrogenase PutA [Gammaproteobacteria bacterium]|nr:MAG: bifunctional proline dehydrogenase/L-glutamate gamma-semialdehyde dehydrogenase PutA [Gammaproteobacteria bacterium]
MLKASKILTQAPANTTDEWMKWVQANYQVDENAYLEELIALAAPDAASHANIRNRALKYIQQVRQGERRRETIEAFLSQYSLDTKEGVVLMCLAEALLRIADAESANRLIKDKLSGADWAAYVGKSDSWLVNASAWGLVLTGKLVELDSEFKAQSTNILAKAINRVGEPVVRAALNQVMKFMGRQFVLGRTIDEAWKRAAEDHKRGYTHSFDMLGEAAFTAEDAERYTEAYANAIKTLATVKAPDGVPAPSISVKLSALHPRYDAVKRERVLTEMYERLLGLAELARRHNVAMSIDAEEADRLEISLELFEKVYRSESLAGWDGLGLVVQAYSKRALPVLGWAAALAQDLGIRMPVRLVKGAYWDSEIKWSQQRGLAGYPLFTRKAGTDVSYLACARYLFSVMDRIYPQFATHNAHTIASILEMAKDHRDFEFQRLHGMGEALYDLVLAEQKAQGTPVNCRVYAPVGQYNELLPYLVRRLLENGANSSFVHQLVDDAVPAEKLAEHPVDTLKKFSTYANDKIPLPEALYGPTRKNSRGTNLKVAVDREPFLQGLGEFLDHTWDARPIIDGRKIEGDATTRVCPYDNAHVVGTTVDASETDLQKALEVAHQHWSEWNRRPAAERAKILRDAADLFEANRMELIALCCREGGKTLEDGIAEVREAVDFLRYYAQQAEHDFQVITLPGPTGERNTLELEGRGVFVCISPWNFPLAIFTGQVSAALVTGNAVLAKPAAQTTMIGMRAVELLHKAGVPTSVLQYIPARGAQVGRVVLSDPRVAGVAFTGSTATAMQIQNTLASRANTPIAPLIAETGGQNAMIVDSSALPEQVVADVMRSAFASAGQRCSALRVLYLQEEIAPRIIELLKGAMAEWEVGDPSLPQTDAGPVIDHAAREDLLTHIEEMRATKKLLAEAPPSKIESQGSFLSPVAFEIDSIHDLKQENFGPILHVVRYRARDLDKIIDEINAYGYGLTLGIHSRNEGLADYIAHRARVGNIYINRDMIGAVVGVQPFGGMGLSGTGPKAGGPFYLHRFCTERTISNNTAAIGGNTTLLSLADA